MKGESHFVEYTLVILLSVVMIVGVTLLAFSFYRSISDSEIKQELRQISAQVSDNVVKLYDVAKSSRASPGNYTSMLISEVNLNLPDKVSNNNYEIFLVSASQLTPLISLVTIDGTNVSTIISNSNARVVGRTNGDPEVEVEYDIPNIDVSVQGKARNGQNTTLRYYKYNINGTIRDMIVLGSLDILINIGSVE